MHITEHASPGRISIHALLAESDVMQEIAQQRKQRISIHALLAESDLTDTDTWRGIQKFLSTLSLRRATVLMGGSNCDD